MCCLGWNTCEEGPKVRIIPVTNVQSYGPEICAFLFETGRLRSRFFAEDTSSSEGMSATGGDRDHPALPPLPPPIPEDLALKLKVSNPTQLTLTNNGINIDLR